MAGSSILQCADPNSITQVRDSLHKTEKTADLQTIFIKENGHKNPHTGKAEDGWWCDVCK